MADERGLCDGERDREREEGERASGEVSQSPRTRGEKDSQEGEAG